MTDDQAFSEWAWMKEGEPIGYMLPHIAARIAFRAGAEWARKQAHPATPAERTGKDKP
jgi:hypothetical protein